MRWVPTRRDKLRVAALLAVCSLLGGCARGRVVVVETMPETSVTTRVDSSVVRAPRLEAMPAAGMRLSFPEAVRRYETALKARAVLGVYEVELSKDRAVVRTRAGETVHRLPPGGETKIIRPDSAGRVLEYVEGEPEKERTEIELPRKPSMWERISGVLLAVVVIAVLVLLVGVLGLVRRVWWRQV